MKRSAPFVVALEGSSGAGKSTLSHGLSLALAPRPLALMLDYSDAAGGPHRLPPAPAKSVEEELEALSILLRIDDERWVRGLKSRPLAELVVMDRSAHTFLAHRLAVSQLMGFDAFGPSCRLAGECPTTHWPDLILYVDTPQALLSARRSPVVPPEYAIFVDPEFNRLFRSYFIPRLGFSTTTLVVLDGTKPPAELLADALVALARAEADKG